MQIHYELISEGSKATCSTYRKRKGRERRRHSQTGSFLGNAYGKYQVKFVCNWNLITDNTHHTHTQTHRMIVLLCCSMFVTLLLRVCVCVCGTVLICNWHCILNRLHLAHQRPGHRDSRTHTHGHTEHRANAKSRDAPSNWGGVTWVASLFDRSVYRKLAFNW